MKSKLAIMTTLVLFVQSPYARVLSSGDAVARDLLIKYLGWVGHVGMGTGDEVGSSTSTVIEVLNENPVGQINTITNFKMRSPYWGAAGVSAIMVLVQEAFLSKQTISVGGVLLIPHLTYIHQGKAFLQPAIL